MVQLCKHLEEIRVTVAEFRKHQFGTKKTDADHSPSSGLSDIENLCHLTIASAIKSTIPPDTDLSDKSVIKEQVIIAMDEFTLSDLMSICFDRNKVGLANCTMSAVKSVLKKFYTENCKNALIDTILRSD